MARSNNDIIVQVNEKPIILQYTKQGLQGPSGAVGPKGDDAISWTLSILMTDTPDGTCTMTLYKNGYTCTETHFVYVMYIPYGNTSNGLQSTPHSQAITGTVSFEYTNTRVLYAMMFDDSSMRKILCTGAVNQGNPSTISVGTVTHLTEDSQPTVVNSGTAVNAVLDFGIPKGQKGDAATIRIGTVTTLAPTANATVENIGDTGNAILNFGIPRGLDGESGNTSELVEPFDPTEEYSEGDYCSYNNQIFKFIDDHTGSWDANDVVEVTIGGELALKAEEADLNALQQKCGLMYYYDYPVNQATNAEMFRITDSRITTDTVMVSCIIYGNGAVTWKPSWTSYDGYIVVTGTCESATTADIILGQKIN